MRESCMSGSNRTVFRRDFPAAGDAARPEDQDHQHHQRERELLQAATMTITAENAPDILKQNGLM
jgi:hypothetical protein